MTKRTKPTAPVKPDNMLSFDPKSAEGRVLRARTALLTGREFIGSLALSLPVEITDAVKTASTDGKRIRFNPDFASRLKDDELVFVIAHEVFHCMLEHVFRTNGRNPRKWNVAADIVVNHMLIEERVGRCPSGAVVNADLYTQGNGIVEQVYDLLPDGDGDGSGDGDGDGNGDGNGDGSGGDGNDPGQDLEPSTSEAENRALASEWKERVVQAALQANAAGQLGPSMKRLVQDMLKPQVDWRDVLRDFIVKTRADIRTFARPARRFATQGLYMPSTTGERIGPVAFFIDCSGSVSDKQLQVFMTEVRAVHADLQPERLHVGYFHHEVTHTDTFDPEDTVTLSPVGTGGTAFSPIFKAIGDWPEPPVACVVLTDLICDDYGPAPDYPVLWVVIPTACNPTTPPFGRVVNMKHGG
jgi:predicted metal-dependent peptidase